MKKSLALAAGLAGCFALASCRSESREYEQVISTLSLAKAREFLERYPEGPYAEQLIDELVIWCEQENGVQCFGELVRAIPQTHRRHREVVSLLQEAIRAAEPRG